MLENKDRSPLSVANHVNVKWLIRETGKSRQLHGNWCYLLSPTSSFNLYLEVTKSTLYLAKVAEVVVSRALITPMQMDRVSSNHTETRFSGKAGQCLLWKFLIPFQNIRHSKKLAIRYSTQFWWITNIALLSPDLANFL